LEQGLLKQYIFVESNVEYSKIGPLMGFLRVGRKCIMDRELKVVNMKIRMRASMIFGK